VKYPYGLGRTPVTHASLKTSLARNVDILLGDRDLDPNPLRKTPVPQGKNRYERGHEFIKEGGERAQELKVAFGWKARTVPGVDHDYRKMSPAAAAFIGH